MDRRRIIIFLAVAFGFTWSIDLVIWLTGGLVFLGEIPRRHPFEAAQPIVEMRDTGEPDFLPDDSALAYRSPAGLVIITGCAHAGICNIVDHARDVCGEERIVDIIGGFHLLDPKPAQLRGTLAYMKALNPEALHACHCTDLKSKIALAGVANLGEVGVGLQSYTGISLVNRLY